MADHTSLNDWNDKDKPRERLKNEGPEALKDYELLAVMLGSGVKGLNVVELAESLLNYVGGNLARLSELTLYDLLNNFKGIGEAKALNILATLEFGRRRSLAQTEIRTVSSSKDIVSLMAPLFADSVSEQFWILLLNRRLGVIARHRVAVGAVSSVVADPKLIMKPAVERLASAIVLCHNHPSGSVLPSNEDKLLTDKISRAAALFDIRLIDHIILTNDYMRYYSFADNGDII